MKRTTRLFSLLITAAMLLNMAACANKPSEAASSAAPQSGGAAEAASQESGSDYSSWPEKNVTIIYYTKAGSGGDIFLRQLAAALNGKLNGHNLLIENIVDPTGATAWGKVQKASPDGYTLACLSSTVVTADLIGGSPVKYEDFDYVTGMGMDPQYIYCRSDAPITIFRSWSITARPTRKSRLGHRRSHQRQHHLLSCHHQSSGN